MATIDKPWHKHYPKGVPKELDLQNYNSLLDLFHECFRKYKDLPAFECMGKGITYGELDILSKDFAAYLQNEADLQKGDKIALQMPNLLQYPIAMIGALRAGLVVVNTNPLYTSREMQHQFTDAGVKAIVILKNFAHNLEKVLPATNIRTVIITGIGDLLGGFKGAIVNFAVKNIKKMVPPYQLPGAIEFKTVLKKGAQLTLKEASTNSEDVAFLQYTGGTTGVSKGAMLSHANMIANTEQIASWMAVRLDEKVETMITALPLYHIYALTVNCLSIMKIGGKNVLITNPRDMKSFVKELQQHHFTAITGVNTLYNGLLNAPGFHKLDFSSLKVASAGGMAVQRAVAEEWKQVTGTPIAEGYGLSETAPVLTTNPIDGTEIIGTIGLPVPNTDIMIADENGEGVAIGQPGEIYAKGPQVMKGYWNRADESGEVFTTDGWFKTGDIGIIEPNGYIKIVDRKKEMINVSGFNVYPNDIEDTIAAHPKVLEVGAIGVPDPKSTEVVKVFVVKKDPSLTAEELLAYCRENMTAYKIPKYIAFKSELPKSNVGKILRRILKEEDTQTAAKALL